MWKPFDSIDPVTRSAGAAVLCTLLSEFLPTGQNELLAETLGWAILPILFRGSGRRSVGTAKSQVPFRSLTTQILPSVLLWTGASIIVICYFLKAEYAIVGLMPALTPLLLIAQNCLGLIPFSWKISDSLSAPLFSNFWVGTIFGTLISVLALSRWDLQVSILCIVPALASFAISYLPLRRSIKDNQLPEFGHAENTLRSLSMRVVAILVVTLGVEAAIFGLPRFNIGPALSLGLSKALALYFTAQTIQYAPWCTATLIGTFSIASAGDPFMHASEVHALSYIFTSALAIGQTINLLPRQAKSRSALWAFFLIPLIPYTLDVVSIRKTQSFANRFSISHKHPVESLTQASKDDFERILQRQSRNYTAAHDEYKRRYGIEPPRGFKAWYEFAVSHQSPIIDEFDAMYEGISPFWKMSGREVSRIIANAEHMADSELWSCGFSGQTAQTNCSHAYRTNDRHTQLFFHTLLGDMTGLLPELKFLVNHLDEPRVMVPLDTGNPQLTLTNMARKPVWDVITKSCMARQATQGETPKSSVETFGLPFITNISSSMDLCQHPEYESMHGLFMSPTSFPLIEGPVPILTPGSPSTMGDILFPSPAYIEPEFLYDAAHDTDWEKKKDNLYWAGSTTGGVAQDDKWETFHRQRFVSLAQNLKREQHYYLREKNAVASRYKSSFFNGRLFDVAFSRLFQCENTYCRDQKGYFNLKSWQHKDQAFRSKLVFDLDGNGISGRYYKLLASKSVPLKQTLLREWHDDRLVPWVHYVPISQSMKEVPELVLYLTSTQRGQQIAKEIAEQGREWFAKSFRDVDLAIYTYRLLLELARLQDTEREPMR